MADRLGITVIVNDGDADGLEQYLYDCLHMVDDLDIDVVDASPRSRIIRPRAARNGQATATTMTDQQPAEHDEYDVDVTLTATVSEKAPDRETAEHNAEQNIRFELGLTPDDVDFHAIHGHPADVKIQHEPEKAEILDTLALIQDLERRLHALGAAQTMSVGPPLTDLHELRERFLQHAKSYALDGAEQNTGLLNEAVTGRSITVKRTGGDDDA